MKVSDLLEVLEDCDPRARVLIAIQPNRPIECYAEKAVVREWYDADPSEGLCRTDVLILQGGDIGYGDQEAWNA